MLSFTNQTSELKSSIKKECDDLSRNYDYLLKNKKAIIKQFENRLIALKEEENELLPIGKKHIKMMDNRSDRFIANLDKSSTIAQDNLALINALKKCKENKGNEIRVCENLLKKLKALDAPSESVPAQV